MPFDINTMRASLTKRKAEMEEVRDEPSTTRRMNLDCTKDKSKDKAPLASIALPRGLL